MKVFTIIILVVSVRAQVIENKNDTAKESYNIISNSIKCECFTGVKCVQNEFVTAFFEIKERPSCSSKEKICCTEWERPDNNDESNSENNQKETHIMSQVATKCECSVGLECIPEDYSAPLFEIKERPKCSSSEKVCCASWEEAESDEENQSPSTVSPQINKGCSYFDLNNSKGSFQNIKDLFVTIPWVVSVTDTNGTSMCIGSLVHENVVLTSASCVYSSEAKNLQIRTGNSNAKQVRGAAKIDQHFEFKHPLPKNNLALITLNQSMNLSQDLQALCLPGQNEEMDTENCVTFVKSSLESYQPGDISVQPSESCDNAGNYIFKPIKDKIIGLKENYICARSKNISNACQTFKSNPLICPLSRDKNLFTQIGMLANVVACENIKSAPQHGYQIFTDIKKEIDWIRKTAKTLGYEIST